MKMTYRKTAFIGLWAGMIFASCSSDEDMITGKTLPQGKYPVAMTVSVESPIARSSVDGTWTNGEKVTVQAITKTGDAYNWNDAVSYPYEINNDIPAALTKKETHYWQRSDETKLMRAWYCADGSTSNTLPDSWSVAADQNETGNGYAESDLLFTAPIEVKFGSTANLIFYHQTAKIIVNIKKMEGIDSADQIQSVKIGDNNLALSGTYTAPSGTGVTTGTWLPGPMDKTITPFKLSQPIDPSKYIASYTALVIPQNMDGKRLIAIDTELGTHYYTPKEGAAELEAGKVHTYNIIIDSKGVTIEIPGSIDWGEGESGSGSIEL